MNHTTLAPVCKPEGAYFFGRIPEPIIQLRAEKKINDRAIGVLAQLMLYCATGRHECFELQESLRLKLGCSVYTLRRALTMLENAGLIIKRKLRNRYGEIKQKYYDLSPTIALCRTQNTGSAQSADESKMPTRTKSQKEAITPNPAKVPMSQKCSVSLKRESIFVKQDNTPLTQGVQLTDTERTVVVSFVSLGVKEYVAVKLVQTYKADRCTQVLDAAKRNAAKFKTVAGYIVAALTKEYQLPGQGAKAPASVPGEAVQGQETKSRIGTGAKLTEADLLEECRVFGYFETLRNMREHMDKKEKSGYLSETERVKLRDVLEYVTREGAKYASQEAI